MTVNGLVMLWTKWLERNGKPEKGSRERTAELAVRDIAHYFEYYHDDLTLLKVSSIPGLGFKRIAYLEDVLGIQFKRKDKPVKPSKPDQVIYVVIETHKDLNSERVTGIYATLELAYEMLEMLWELYGRVHTYRIDPMTVESKKEV